MCAGASSSELDVSAFRSASLSGDGAKRPPSHSAAIASASSLRSSFNIPSTRARALSSPMMKALEARRRSTSQTRPEMAARSPEPAKRCAVPHSFKAPAAGTRLLSMVSINSMAAESRAAGVIQTFSNQKKNLQREIDPHRQQHKGAGKPGHRAAAEIVGTDEDAGMGQPADHEHPGQHHDDEVRMADRQRDRDQHVKQHRELELV